MTDITEHVILTRRKQTILAGSGATSDLPPHAGSHQVGGSDELWLDGLKGLLADPQKAGYIGEVPINLGGLDDEYILKYSLSTNTWIVVADGGGGESTLQEVFDNSTGGGSGDAVIATDINDFIVQADGYYDPADHYFKIDAYNGYVLRFVGDGAQLHVNDGNTFSIRATDIEFRPSKTSSDYVRMFTFGGDTTLATTEKSIVGAINELVAGGGGGNATSLRGVTILDTVPSANAVISKAPNGVYKKNIIKYSEDLSNETHTKIRMNVIGTDGLAATSDNASHSFATANSFPKAGRGVVAIECKANAKEWFGISNTSTADVAYFNSNDLRVGTQTAGTFTRISDLGEGWALAEFECKVNAGSNGIYIYVANGNADIVYAGDGTTVSGYIRAIHYKDGTLDDGVGYIKTEGTINSGTQYFEVAESEEYKPVDIFLGDSITMGHTYSTPSVSFPEYIQQNYPERKIINLGVSGATTEVIIKQTLLRAVKNLNFSFNNICPFSAVNDAVLTVASNELVITQGATSSPSAKLDLFDAGQVLNFEGYIQGDGTANPTIESDDAGVLFTGTSSATPQAFSFSHTVTDRTDFISFVVNGGSSSNTITLLELKISLVDGAKKADTLYLMCGVNDIVAGETTDNIKIRKAFIYEQCYYNGIKSISLGITPSNSYAGWDATKKAKIATMNDWDYLESEKTFFVNMSDLGDSSGELLSVFDSGDHLHPNGLGNQKIRDLVIDQYMAGKNLHISHASGELKNVATGVDEIPVLATPYYAPDQSRGMGFPVHRVYYAHVADDEVVVAGATKMLGQSGRCDVGSNYFPTPHSESATIRALLEQDISSGDIRGRIAGVDNIEILDGHVDYIP